VKMLQARLRAVGLLEGETGHSFRRGTLQSTAAAQGFEAAAHHGRLRSASTVARYLHPTRHLSRFQPS
jgi:hypothetical protein